MSVSSFKTSVWDVEGSSPGRRGAHMGFPERTKCVFGGLCRTLALVLNLLRQLLARRCSVTARSKARYVTSMLITDKHSVQFSRVSIS